MPAHPASSLWALPQSSMTPMDALTASSQPPLPAAPAAALPAAPLSSTFAFAGGGASGSATQAAKPKIALGDLMKQMLAPKSD